MSAASPTITHTTETRAAAFLVGDDTNGRVQHLEEKVALAKHFVGLSRVRNRFFIDSFIRVVGQSNNDVGRRRTMEIFIDLQDYGKAGHYHSDDPTIESKEFLGLKASFAFKENFDVRAFFQAVLTAVAE